MNKVLVSYFVGAAISAAVTGFIFKEHYSRIADEEIESVKKMAKEKLDEFSVKANDILGGMVNEEVLMDDRPDDSECDSVSDEDEGAGRINYSSKFKGKGEVDDILNTLAEQEYPGESSGKKKNKGKKKGCKIIKADDYDSDPQYKKLTVYYYVGDGVIADEYDEDHLKGRDDRILGKYSDFIPNDILDKFGFINDDEQTTIFIRNDDISTDFEVIKDFGTFAELKREE